jgi:hypothetical protein
VQVKPQNRKVNRIRVLAARRDNDNININSEKSTCKLRIPSSGNGVGDNIMNCLSFNHELCVFVE